MNMSLCISIRFIQPYPLFHGMGDAGKAEWPPSPMRVYQALLNAACLRYRGKSLPLKLQSVLHALEVIRPLIIAPHATLSIVGHRVYVPHNHADLVTAAWHRGNTEASIASHRIEKDHHPMRLHVIDDDLPTIHYLYPLDTSHDDPQLLLDTIRPSIRSIYCLGWGIDHVIADAQLIADEQSAKLNGKRYAPASSGSHVLRVPRKGSFDALNNRHVRFLNRLLGSDWTPVPPLTMVDQVRYCRDDEPASHPHVVFKLLDPEEEDSARYPHAKLMHIAAMVRNRAIKACQNAGYDDDFINRFVRGKNEPQQDDHKQLSYVPLPSVGHQHSDAMIRNVMLIAPVGMESELEKVKRMIDGEFLTPKPNHDEEGCDADSVLLSGYRAMLQSFTPPKGKFIAQGYLGRHRIWHTVTPVILDEHIDTKTKLTSDGQSIKYRDPQDFQRLIRLALSRAGIETPCQFTWQTIPFLKNCLTAHRYGRDKKPTGYYRPKRLDGKTAVHVRIEFEHPVPGPITLGAGRHCGFGLMIGEQNGEQTS